MKTPLLMLLVVMVVAACGGSSTPQAGGDAAAVKLDCPSADADGNLEIVPGLTARILEKGYGRAAVVGDYADTNVSLWLFDAAAEDRRGDFVWESGDEVFQFQLGAGQVIKGWDLGVPCMLEGEVRELVVPAKLAYGSRGRDEIPPNATLIFLIELVKLTAPQ